MCLCVLYVCVVCFVCLCGVFCMYVWCVVCVSLSNGYVCRVREAECGSIKLSLRLRCPAPRMEIELIVVPSHNASGFVIVEGQGVCFPILSEVICSPGF